MPPGSGASKGNTLLGISPRGLATFGAPICIGDI